MWIFFYDGELPLKMAYILKENPHEIVTAILNGFYHKLKYLTGEGGDKNNKKTHIYFINLRYKNNLF